MLRRKREPRGGAGMTEGMLVSTLSGQSGLLGCPTHLHQEYLCLGSRVSSRNGLNLSPL